MPKKFPQLIIVVIFALTYTLVVLPFTVNFFGTIASVPTVETKLFTVIPLEQAHIFMLPLFLAALEFASIQLARRFWIEAERSQRVLIFVLFFLCQSFAVVSVYYDIRTRAYDSEQTYQTGVEKQMRADKEKRLTELKLVIAGKKAETFASKRNEIESLSRQIAAKTAELNQRSTESTQINQQITDLFSAPSDSSTLTMMANELRERRTLRTKREVERATILREQIRLEQQRESLASGLREDIRKNLADVAELETDQRSLLLEIGTVSGNDSSQGLSEIGYIAKTATSFSSVATAFVSFLFPITVMGIGFVIRTEHRVESVSRLTFSREIAIAGSYPPEGQRTIAKQIVAVISTYIVGLRAAKELGLATNTFHLQDEVKRVVLDELLSAKQEIQKSKLAEEAKQYLIDAIDNLINQQLIQEGANKL